MIRTLNFTGRQRILREEAKITIYPAAGDGVAFDADLDLARLNLPADANVFVEAAFKTTFMRFHWGTVAQLSPPEDRLLSKLEQPDLAHFRVKAVESATDGFGRLLAVADHIRPEGMRDGAKRRISLFRVSVTKSLSEELWRLNLDDDEGPLIELPPIQGIKDIARQPEFMALVYPEVVRQILKRVFEEGHDDPEFDRDSWLARWLRFGKQHAKENPPLLVDNEMEAEHGRWIDAAVAGFSQRLKLVTEFKKRFATVEGDQQ